jgi:dipeptidyl aminopeptidase/acylaminoacyl peptidase
MEVWVAKSDGTGQVQLTHMGAPITGSPRWSPDGQRIVFDSNVGGQFQIYIVSRNGGKPIRLSSHLADEAVGSWSVDGRWIYFTSSHTGHWQIWKMPAKGGESVQLTRGGGRVPFESADGFVYYAKAEGHTDLWRVPAQGGSETEVIRGISWEQFSVVDDGVYFIKSDLDRARSIVFYESATGKTTTLANIEGPLSFGLSISPDRRSALFSKADERGADLMLVENMR